MMQFLSHRRKKYLIMLPIVFLVINAFYFMHASKEIQKTLLKEKYVEVINAVDMLATAVEASPNYDYESNIRDSVEFMDKLYQIYTGAYKLIDGDIVLITDRIYETSSFEPFDYYEFSSIVFEQEDGRLIIGYTPENQTYRELYLYFRWMPVYSLPSEQYLVVAGVSQYSITAAVAQWVSIGQLASMAITFIIDTWLIILLVHLGYVYEQRGNNKWRKERR